MTKRLLILATVLTAGSLILGFGTEAIANAQTTTKTTTTTSHGTNRHNLSIRLNQAVRDGTITKNQKTAFLTELKTLQKERKSVINKSSTTTQRQAERTKLQSELQTWVSSNSFPLSKIAPKLSV